ncbi:MAG: outer membrane beta-barrel protein [Acidobacteriota bacterium]
MRKLLLLVAVLFVSAIPASAQDYPSAEIFGGYAYANIDVFDIDRDSLNGFGVSFAGNLGPRFGLVAEFGGYYGDFEGIDIDAYTYLFGPRVNARGEAATGFAHILLGGATTKVEGVSETDFALAVGGGVDINAGKSVAFRLQFDYLPVFAEGETLHNFRFMTGIVFKVGNK